jgi:hypothetical protein
MFYWPGLVSQPYLTLPALLRWTTYRQCTDPRDRIYGILSLLPSKITAEIDPDYTLSVFQVYMDGMLAHLNSSKNLILLTDCRFNNRFLDGPTWVPSWSVPAGQSGFLRRLNDPSRPCGFSEAEYRFLAPHTLEVTGKYCGKVSFASRSVKGTLDKVFKDIREWEAHVERSLSCAGNSSYLDAFLDVITHGRTKNPHLVHGTFPQSEELRADYLAAASDPSTLGTLRHLGSVTFDNEVLITTGEGQIGIAPEGAQESTLLDYICPPNADIATQMTRYVSCSAAQAQCFYAP